jgi:hypothetical protein
MASVAGIPAATVPMVRSWSMQSGKVSDEGETTQMSGRS